jgi:hypothetical protein
LLIQVPSANLESSITEIWLEASCRTTSLAVSILRCLVGPLDKCNFDAYLSVVEILVIISFFLFLSLAEWLSAKVLRAGIIGQIAVGIIYGVPLANILEKNWQETFLALGYVGLILIIFEGRYMPFFVPLSVLTSIISRWPWRSARSSEGKSGGEHSWRCHRCLLPYRAFLPLAIPRIWLWYALYVWMYFRQMLKHILLGAVETFIIGAALSATSLGNSF